MEVISTINCLALAGQSVAPVMLIILIGMLLRKIKWLNVSGDNVLDKLSFRLLLPMTLFKNIYNSDFETAFDAQLVLTAVGMAIVSFGLAIFLAGLKEKDLSRKASLAQSIFRNNCLVFGLPIISAMYGENEVAVFSMVLAFMIPVNNILSVVLMSLLTSRKIKIIDLCKRIITNSYVLFAVAALLIKLIGVVLPQSAVKVVSDISATATPMALLGLGAGLQISDVRKDLRSVTYGTVMRLIGMPLIFLPLLVLMGIKGAPLVSLFFVIGTPCAVACYPMAKEMGADGELAGHLVVVQSLCCILTIFLFLSAMGYLNWL